MARRSKRPLHCSLCGLLDRDLDDDGREILIGCCECGIAVCDGCYVSKSCGVCK